MIKVTALGKVSQMNLTFYQNISKKEEINIQWSIQTLLPTPYIRHHKKKEKKGTALPLPDWPQTPPQLRDELWWTETGEHAKCSATSCHLAAGVVRQKGGEAQKSVRKSNRGGYRVRVATATQWTHNPLLLGEYHRKQSRGRQALTYKML